MRPNFHIIRQTDRKTCKQPGTQKCHTIYQTDKQPNRQTQRISAGYIWPNRKIVLDITNNQDGQLVSFH